jgi:hypothetical protein
MFKNFSLTAIIATMILLAACKKDGFNPMTDTKPDIPVTVSNLYGTFVAPTVASNTTDSIIKITLSIPATSGRTIKEITRVASATSYKSVQVTTGLYNTAPIPGSGTSVTFTSTLREYINKTGKTVPAPNTASSFLSTYFFFLVTLDDGSTIIPTYVKVYVTK